MKLSSNNISKVYTVTLEDAKDGSDDVILPFPNELIEELGWVEGDLLDFDIIGDRVIIKKLGKK